MACIGKCSTAVNEFLKTTVAASICKGHDGRYYLVGNRGDDRPDINFWVSEDFITWKKYGDYTPDLKHLTGLPETFVSNWRTQVVF